MITKVLITSCAVLAIAVLAACSSGVLPDESAESPVYHDPAPTAADEIVDTSEPADWAPQPFTLRAEVVRFYHGSYFPDEEPGYLIVRYCISNVHAEDPCNEWLIDHLWAIWWNDFVLAFDAHGESIPLSDIPAGSIVDFTAYGHSTLDGLLDGDFMLFLRNAQLIQIVE